MNQSDRTESVTTTDPQVDDILARHIEARGGFERIMSITTLKQKGRVKMGRVWLALSAERKRPDLLRIEFSFNGVHGIEGWDGERAWEINPWKGMNRAEYVGGAVEIAMRRGCDFDGALIDHNEKGHKIAFAGEETVKDRPVYHLSLIHKEGYDAEYYLDRETLQITKLTTVRSLHGSEPVQVTTLIEEYRPVMGVLFPFRWVEFGAVEAEEEVYEWAEIEANAPISDSRFTLPLP